MYRLCNPIDTSIYFDAADLNDLLDFRKVVENNILYRNAVTPSHYFKWLTATITDDNWLTYLEEKVLSNQGFRASDYPNSYATKLSKLIFANRPKWLMEFVHLYTHGNICTLGISYPRIASGNEGISFAQDEIVFNIETNYRDPYGLDRTGGHELTIPDASMTAIYELLDKLADNFMLYLTTSSNRHSDTDREYLLRVGSQSHFTKFLFGYVQDRSCIKYSRANREIETIRPSTAYNRYTQLFPDARNRVNFDVIRDGASIYVKYSEPRVPASRDQLSTILNYTTNVLDYLPFNIRGKQEELAPLYGIELEACSDYSPEQIIAAQQELFFIMKQDGSITGDGRYKYEMVTVPATAKAHKRLWAEFFNKVDYTKFDTTKSTGNGMHVHIDRKAFKAKGHLNRFTWFFINPANHDFLFEISERPNKNDWTRWAPLPMFPTGQSKPKTMQSAVRANGNLRGTVHFKGDKTVEIRMFKGVVSYATVVKNLEFVDSVVQFSLETSLTNITLPNYFAWLKAQPKNRYQMIREFISQFKSIEQILMANELKEYLFSATKPETILAKLQQAKFKVTNKHLTILNRERRKRTFILDKEGNLQLAYSNGGKLASLDKALQAKMTRGSSSISISLV